MSILQSFEFTVQKTEEGVRLDKFLTFRLTSYSRHFFQTLIAEQRITVNDSRVHKSGIFLQAGDTVRIQIPANPFTNEENLVAEPIPLKILYEDDAMLIINKPRGLVVHPAAGHRSGTLANGLLFHCHELKKEFQDELTRPGIIHRLDKDTSGLIIAVKTLEAKNKYGALFSSRKINKEYLAVCIGVPKILTIKTQIIRHPIKRKEMTVTTDVTKGKEAVTHCEVIVNNGKLSLVRLRPITGRTHQLRVHLKYIGCPILGDSVYGFPGMNKHYNCEQQLLHAYKLRFNRISDNEPLEFIADCPNDMKLICSKYLSYEL